MDVNSITDLKSLVESGDLYLHHTARARGYISRKGDGVVKHYAGKFGEGWVHYAPAFDSRQYCYISYYIVTN